MEAAVRFSQNSLPSQPNQYFLKIDVADRTLHLYNIKNQKKSNFSYENVFSSRKLSPFRAFDWHPSEAPLVAIGQTSGEACLVNLAEPDQVPITYTVRSPRSCNAVGLSTLNWLAAGLEKVRNDFCLNIWDLNQRLNPSTARAPGKSINEPLHKLAPGEPITSLRFFQDQPKLLAAGVKGQFIRLYDLRESTSNFALQFSTRCVNNIGIDNLDENYFVSCLPSPNPMVTVWDRRMVTRTNTVHYGFGTYISQSTLQPEPSVELRDVIKSNGQIWGMRLSKTHRGQLGVISSTGQLRILRLGHEYKQTGREETGSKDSPEWDKQEPQNTHLDDVQNFSNAYNEHPKVEELKRIVSFDFTTATSSSGEARIITLTGDGKIEMSSLRAVKEVYAVPLRTGLLDGRILIPPETVNRYKTATRQSIPSQFRDADGETQSSSNVSKYRKRAEIGYLLDASANTHIISEDDELAHCWSWLRHSEQFATTRSFVQSDIDLSYLGISALWTAQVDVRNRSTKASGSEENIDISSTIRDIVRNLNLHRGKGCATRYPANRALCLHVSGSSYTHDAIEDECNVLINQNEHAKGAAIALFAGEEKIAQRALRAKGSTQNHKLLAMALLGARQRSRGHHRQTRTSINDDSDSESSTQGEEEDLDWQDIITTISSDLSDPYSLAILAYVKTGNWQDVTALPTLPLRYKLNIALRHFTDPELTKFISATTTIALTTGDLSALPLTGLGTPDSVSLLQTHARNTGDLQTAVLILSFAAASDIYLAHNTTSYRTVQSLRATYRTFLLDQGLAIQKARFDVSLARSIRASNNPSHQQQQQYYAQRIKPQIRIICPHCDQSLAQFNQEPRTTHDNNNNNNNNNTSQNQQQQQQQQHPHPRPQTQQNGTTTTTTPITTQWTQTPNRHPLQAHNPSAEKAALAGVLCPKCGRNLPRCGVCNMWLGTADESWSKWYKPTTNTGVGEGESGGGDGGMVGSLVGSTVTAIGPLAVGKVEDERVGSGSAGRGGVPGLVVSGSGSKTASRAGSDSKMQKNHNLNAKDTSASGSAERKITTADVPETVVETDGEAEGDSESEEQARKEREEKRWWDAMHRFTVYCVRCGHGFHAEHARMWFGGEEGREVCPVAGCGCSCVG